MESIILHTKRIVLSWESTEFFFYLLFLGENFVVVPPLVLPAIDLYMVTDPSIDHFPNIKNVRRIRFPMDLPLLKYSQKRIPK